jgi:hypothetical protein
MRKDNTFNRFGVIGKILLSHGTGPYQAHISPENVPDLRQLVDFRDSENSSDFENAKVIFYCDVTGRQIRTVLQHRRKLNQ